MLQPVRSGHEAAGRRLIAGNVPGGVVLIIVLTLLGAVLRFATLAHQSYWVDESQAVHELGLSFAQMLHSWNAYEWNPPLYLIVAWPWAKLFGTGAVGLRSLSALLGTALIPLLYLCARRLVSERAGLVAAAFAAVNPFMIWYSQEAREYMLLMVLCTASLLFFIRAWPAPRRRDLMWWGVLSVLALLTQYFAAFLIAPEALALLVRWRRRDIAVIVGGLVVVELALLPHVLPRLDHPVQFIVSIPLSLRIQQVPVTFAMNTLYKGGLVSWGLVGAAVVAGAMIAQLVIGADERELRGAGVAAALATFVLLVPLGLALIGHDDYLARGLMPGWVPLAIVLAAACTPRRAVVTGALLAIVMLAMFVYAGIRIESDSAFEKVDWRGVASALGSTHSTRVIVTSEGTFAGGPLSVYLPRVAWSGPGHGSPGSLGLPVSEFDIVSSTEDTVSRLPPGARIISSRAVDGYRVLRLELTHPWNLPPDAYAVRAAGVLSPAPLDPLVLIQRRP